MSKCVEPRGVGVASTSQPALGIVPCRLHQLSKRKRRGSALPVRAAQLGPLLTSARPGPGDASLNRMARHNTSRRPPDGDFALPFYTCLDGDILTPANKFAYYEALRSGLKALRALGINGISVDVYWGIVEGVRPLEYDWSSYKQLFALIRDEGFMAQVCLCFHATDAVPLPAWVVEAGRSNPDIYYADRAGARSTDYISLGANEVPALAGRTALECYRDLMTSFRQELGPLFGGTIADVLIGLGPDGELKYPAHPRDKRWNFPGIGEFQCYDKYMLSMLRACSYQVNQPSWGLRGPHDAGTYCVWPHQTGFFHQRGNWGSPYGKFFLQWYSDLLVQHADSVLGIAKEVLLTTHHDGSRPGGGAGGVPDWARSGSSNGGLLLPSLLDGGGGGYLPWGLGGADDDDVVPALRLHAKLPGIHWWYNTASHAPELTAGYYNTATRDGYLPVMNVLARHGVCARLRSAELRNSEMPPQACSDPESQLAQQRTVAAALLVPVGLENVTERFDDSALSRLEGTLFDTSVHQGIELPQVQSLVFNRMCDSMFEPGNWARFKDFVRRVRNRADTLVAAPGCGSSSAAAVAMAAAAGAGGPVQASGQHVLDTSAANGGALQLV